MSPTPSRLTLVLVVAAMGLLVPPAVDAAGAPSLRPGAVEVGFAGALVSVEGATRLTLAAHGGSFLAVGPGLGGYELEVGYSHQRDLDTVDLAGNLSYTRRIRTSAVYRFVSVGGGLREESLGSFRQARYPVGFGLGLTALFSDRAAARIEYRYRRVLNDPIADYTEHQALTGISVFFRNSSRPQEGEPKSP